MLQLARGDKHVWRRAIHLQQPIMRHVEVHLGRHGFGRGEDGVEGPLAHDMPNEIRHAVFDLGLAAGTRGLGLVGFRQEFFAPEVEENVERGEGDGYFVDGEGAGVWEADGFLDLARRAGGRVRRDEGMMREVKQQQAKLERGMDGEAAMR